MDFIIDRTNEDITYAQSFIGGVWSKMTNEQKEEWLKGMTTPLESLKGFFNYTDMVRIKNNYNSLRNMYDYSGDSISTTYTMETIPNRTTMSADFEKIRQFAMHILPYFLVASFSDYRTANTMESDVNKIDYNFLNNYEHLLKNLYDKFEDVALDVKCEFNIEETRYTLDGYLTHSGDLRTIETIVPSGYIAKVQSGSYSGGAFTPRETIISTSGEVVSIEIQTPYRQYYLEVESGIQSSTLVGAYGTVGNTVDVTNFDKVSLDCDMLMYSMPTTYTATEIQSDMIDVSGVIKMYCYNISDYGENTIITLYDENEDTFDEIVLREDMFIDLQNVSYITFDTEVGTEITYVKSYGVSFNQLYITINGVGYVYPDYTEFDVSDVNSIKITNPAPYSNKFVCLIQKSIENGKDISQLDTNEIRVTYI